MITKMTIEVEVSTQFGPSSAINAIKNALNFPAIKSASILELKTDWKPEPGYSPQKNVNYLATQNIPLSIK